MSKILIGAMLAALAMSKLAWAEQRLPVFDVRPECRAVASVMPVQKCMEDEQTARADLERKWSGFTDGDRGHCIREASAGGSPSYVDLLTCLELAREARQLEK